MSLRLVLAALQNSDSGNFRNVLLQVVHETIEELAAVEKRREGEVSGLKEMFHLLEQGLNERVEMVERELRGEIDVLAKASEVGGLTAGHLGVGMS
jgi:hypothetical protein